MAATHSVASDTASHQDEVTAQQAYLALARRLRQLRVPILGLWPISMKTRFVGVPVRLAKALAALGLHVGVMAPDQWRNEPPTNQPPTTVLSEGVESIRPTSARANVSATLERTLGKVRERYDCILLDLSGLSVIALKEVALVPEVGIVVFVIPGKLTGFALARLRRQLTPERLLGAVLVDEEPGAFERSYGR